MEGQKRALSGEMSGGNYFVDERHLRSFNGGWERSLEEVNTEDLSGDGPGQEGLALPGKAAAGLLYLEEMGRGGVQGF